MTSIARYSLYSWSRNFHWFMWLVQVKRPILVWQLCHRCGLVYWGNWIFSCTNDRTRNHKKIAVTIPCKISSCRIQCQNISILNLQKTHKYWHNKVPYSSQWPAVSYDYIIAITYSLTVPFRLALYRSYSLHGLFIYMCKPKCSIRWHMERALYFIARTSSMPEELCISAGGLLLLTRGTIALFSPSSGGLIAWAYRKSLPCGLDSIVYDKES
jgi:hypothetical protein